MQADDAEFSNRFTQLFKECGGNGTAADAVTRVVYSVHTHGSPSVTTVRIDGGRLDLIEFTIHLFGGRGYSEVPVDGRRRGLAPSADGPAMLVFDGNEILVDRRTAWQRFVANLAVNQVLGQQPDLLCFHAASLGVNSAGMLLTGPKGAGKTTLALALAARGHDFLGDEVAAVRAGTRLLLPFRRSVSVRPGPTAAAVRRVLDGAELATEAFPDGTTRLRGQVGALFPASRARPAPLRAVVVLRGFGGTTRLRRFTPGREDWPLLSPLGCSLWGVRPPERVMRVVTLFSGVRCYYLDARSADAAADALEHLPED